MTRTRLAIPFTLALAGLAMAPVASATQLLATKHASHTAHVSILERKGRYYFQPASITVKRGTLVVWTNHSNAYHTVTDSNGAWSSSGFKRNQSYSRRFTKVGKDDYTCGLHGYMFARVIVKR